MHTILNRANYRAWLVEGQEFPASASRCEQLLFLLRYAILAPSSHNAQPWHFFVFDDRIEIGVDRSRALPVADPDDRLLRLALGAALEYIIIAGKHFGISLNPIINMHPTDQCMAIAQVSPAKVHNEDEELFAYIPHRHVDRAGFVSELIPHDAVQRLERSVLPGMYGELVQGDLKNTLATLYLDARDEVMEPARLRREMAKFKKTNITRSKVGMPGFTMGFSTLASFFVPTVLKHINVAKMARKEEENIMYHGTPALMVLGVDTPARDRDILAGRSMARCMLVAGALGYGTSVIASAVVSEYYRDQLREAVRWPLQIRPVIMLRVGRSVNEPKPSPRLSVQDVATVKM